MGEHQVLTLVHNDADEPLPGLHDQYSTSLEPEPGMLIVRPTPQAADLVRDVLCALDKDPHAVPKENLATLWELARAWIGAHEVEHIIVDRAHLFTGDQIKNLVDLGTDLTLIWSAYQRPRTLPLGGGRQMQVHSVLAYAVSLGARLRDRPRRTFPSPSERFPDLPQVDFPRFRAACRDRLSPHAFTRVDELYRTTYTQTLHWERSVRDTPGHPDDFPVVLTAHLRDSLLGPLGSLTDPQRALIRLRAAQAALLRTGWLLRWNPARLGPDPATALCGHLDKIRTRRLQGHCRTDHVAATALALHLDQAPRFFDAITCQDVDDSGSLLWHRTPDVPHYPHPTHNTRPRPVRDFTRTEYAELTQQPVRLPPHARTLMAAHRLRRAFQGATGSDPFFVHTDSPGRANPELGLRNGVRTLCRDLRVDRPWLHSHQCQRGADIGEVPRLGGWMRHRALSLTPLGE
jgi:hypothetical protein